MDTHSRYIYIYILCVSISVTREEGCNVDHCLLCLPGIGLLRCGEPGRGNVQNRWQTMFTCFVLRSVIKSFTLTTARNIIHVFILSPFVGSPLPMYAKGTRSSFIKTIASQGEDLIPRDVDDEESFQHVASECQTDVSIDALPPGVEVRTSLFLRARRERLTIPSYLLSS